jgi:NitT/TauT family transport system substrate-binding protein
MTKLSATPSHDRRTFLLGCLLPVLTALAGCHKPQGLLKVCRHPWPGYMLLDLARAQGWLPEDQFRLINLGSAKGTLRALIGNSVDVACLTLDEVLRARANGFMLQVIGVINFSRGATLIP